MLDFLEKIAKIIGAGAAIFGVYTYYDSIQQSKVTRTIEYHDQYHSGEILQSRKYIGKLSYQWGKIINQNGSELNVDELTALVLQDLSIDKSRIHVDIVIEFYDKLHVCVNSGGCDGESLDRFFNREASIFAATVAPLVVQVREANGKFAQGLLCIAGALDTETCEEV